jgi:hypothetical protein
MYYRFPTQEEASPLVGELLPILAAHLQRDASARDDTRSLRRILAMNPQELALQQRTGVACCSRESRR